MTTGIDNTCYRHLAYLNTLCCRNDFLNSLEYTIDLELKSVIFLIKSENQVMLNAVDVNVTMFHSIHLTSRFGRLINIKGLPFLYK